MKELPKNTGPEILAPGIPLPEFRTWHPDHVFRKAGYVNNPDTCRHRIKGYTPADGWWCKECGEELKDLK